MARTRTADIKPYGLNSDLAPSDAPPGVWNEAEGFFFEDGLARRIFGYQHREPPPLFSPEQIHYRQRAGQNWWYYAGPDGVGVNVGSASYDITPAGWSAVSSGGFHWTSLNDVPVLSHPEFDAPYYHGTAADQAMEELPGWPATWRTRRIVAFKYYLFALGVSDDTGEYWNQARWSASADTGNIPNEWVPAADNDAGDMFFSDEPGDLMDAVSLGDNLIVYKGGAQYMVQYMGGVFVMAQRSLMANIGILAPGCAVEHMKHHYLVTEGDIVRHDGAQMVSICDGRTQKAIFGDMSTALRERSFVYLDTPRNMLYFQWPSASAVNWCDRRAIYNITDDVWAVHNWPGEEISHAAMGSYILTGSGSTWAEPAGVTWDQDFGRWSETADAGVNDQALMALADALELGEPIAGGTLGGETPRCRLVWATKSLDAETRDKFVKRLYVVADASAAVNLRIRCGFQSTPGAATVFTPWKNLSVGNSADAYVDILRVGRYVTIEIETDTAEALHLMKMLMEFQLHGGD